MSQGLNLGNCPMYPLNLITLGCLVATGILCGAPPQDTYKRLSLALMLPCSRSIWQMSIVIWPTTPSTKVLRIFKKINVSKQITMAINGAFQPWTDIFDVSRWWKNSLQVGYFFGAWKHHDVMCSTWRKTEMPGKTTGKFWWWKQRGELFKLKILVQEISYFIQIHVYVS